MYDVFVVATLSTWTRYKVVSCIVQQSVAAAAAAAAAVDAATISCLTYVPQSLQLVISNIQVIINIGCTCTVTEYLF